MYRTSEKNPSGQPGRTTPAIDPAHEQGVVLIWALLTTFIIVGIALSASERVRASLHSSSSASTAADPAIWGALLFVCRNPARIRAAATS